MSVHVILFFDTSISDKDVKIETGLDVLAHLISIWFVDSLQEVDRIPAHYLIVNYSWSRLIRQFWDHRKSRQLIKLANLII